MMMEAHGIPKMGLGTWLRTGDEGYRAIVTALGLGYRHIDTAQTYDTEQHVGRAVRESALSRDEVFITTKIADTNLARRDFLPSLERSLERLGLESVDMTLIHWPVPPHVVPFASYIEDLAEARQLGMTRLIGVSNFPCALVAEAVKLLGPDELATNQVELHPYLQNRQVRECCGKHAISVTAYMPLARGAVVSDPMLKRIGAAHDVGGAEVALAWSMQRGMVVIPASGSRDHMAANLRARQITLTEAELALVDTRDRGERLVDPAKSPKWD